MRSRKSQMPSLIRQLYGVVARLEAEFGRKFTPDGHLVGSIGEVIGAAHFGLTLHAPSHEGHDARASNGREVEIKATQGSSVALRSRPEHLIVLKLTKQGDYDVIYNGPGEGPWNASGPMGTNGQRRVSLAKLRSLMKNVLREDKLDTV